MSQREQITVIQVYFRPKLFCVGPEKNKIIRNKTVMYLERGIAAFPPILKEWGTELKVVWYFTL